MYKLMLIRDRIQRVQGRHEGQKSNKNLWDQLYISLWSKNCRSCTYAKKDRAGIIGGYCYWSA